jgi:hypothetical protein
MLPMLGFLRINTAILQGYKKIAISLLPSFLLRPLLLIIPLAIIFVQGIFITPLDILLLYALTIFAALLLSQYFCGALALPWQKPQPPSMPTSFGCAVLWPCFL